MSGICVSLHCALISSGTVGFHHQRAAALSAAVPVELRCSDPTDFSTRVTIGALGPVAVEAIATRCRSALEFHRTPSLIRRSDTGAYRLVLNVRAHRAINHNGHEAVLGPGDLAFYDTSRPFDGHRAGSENRTELVMVTFPRDRLQLPSHLIEKVCGVRLSGTTGTGALVAGVLPQVVRDLDRYQPQERMRLSAVLVDLVVSLLAHELATDQPAGRDAAVRTLMVRVQAFIRQRLGDPALSPDQVAAAHGVSTRHLQRLFQVHGLTVAGWIRAQRLERCRRDLGDPLLAALPVQAVGARWGLTDAAHFSRSFRSVYGISPVAFRRDAQRPGPADADRQAVVAHD